MVMSNSCSTCATSVTLANESHASSDSVQPDPKSFRNRQYSCQQLKKRIRKTSQPVLFYTLESPYLIE
jgi:hypothetical protein